MHCAVVARVSRYPLEAHLQHTVMFLAWRARHSRSGTHYLMKHLLPPF